MKLLEHETEKREIEKELGKVTGKWNTNVEDAESAVLLRFSSTLEHRGLATRRGLRSRTVFEEVPAGAFWGFEHSRSTTVFINRQTRG